MPEESNQPQSDKEICDSAMGEHKNDCSPDSSYIERRNLLDSSLRAFRYIKILPGNRFRYSDRATDILGGVSILLLLATLVMPPNQFQVPLMVLCDVLFLLTIIAFTMNRLGILNALSERQFILVWDIILGAFILGIIFSANYALILNHIRHIAKQF